jgi:thioesterase domain-containing protein
LIIAGYSSGGIIAYEMRNQLEAIGRNVKMLIVFDGSAEITSNFKLEPHTIKVKILKFCWKISHPAFIIENKIKRFSNKYRLFRSADSDDYLLKLNHIIEKYDLAFASYQLQPSYGTIHLFKAKKRIYFEIDSKFLGWQKYTGNEIRIYTVPGNHNTMLKPPHVKHFARILQDLLDNA